MSSMPEMNLRRMAINQTGTITAVRVGGELGRRIREMGLVPGTEITVKQRAPLNDPVALRVMGGTLTLRNSEADHIMVKVAEPSPAP
jgi:ferrous iron transport protein A